MKILVFGAGVVGSFYAARLRETGNDVSLLARGARLDELREQGIVLEPIGEGANTAVPIDVVESLDPDDAYDLVVVTVRCNHVDAILPMLAAHSATPNVAFLGNNVSGADALVAALGRERVILGFGAVGGVRQDGVIRYVPARRGGKTFLGELDGTYSSRLQRIAQAFERTGRPVSVERDMDGWLKTHAAIVVPLAYAIYLADGDPQRLARTRDGLVLARRAIRECFEALRVRDIAITPGWARVVEWIPEPAMVALMGRILRSRRAEIGLAGHANAARDEMRYLANELEAVIRPAKTSTAALDHLLAFGEPGETPMLDGRASIPLDWRGVWIGAGSLAAALLILRRFLPQG